MRLKTRVRNLVVGENKYIESYGEYKQTMLSGQFALIGIFLCSLYLLFDIVVGAFGNIPVFFCAISLLITSILLHRKGDHNLANYFLLPTVNITFYLIAASESPNTGAFIFFIVNSIAAFAVFS